jgi:hypothetical protein
MRNERHARRGWEEEHGEKEGRAKPIQRDGSMKKSHRAWNEWKKWYGREKKSVTRQAEQESRMSRRSEQADHGRGPRGEEHQQDGQSEPDAAARRCGSGQAVHDYTRSHLVQWEALGRERQPGERDGFPAHERKDVSTRRAARPISPEGRRRRGQRWRRRNGQRGSDKRIGRKRPKDDTDPTRFLRRRMLVILLSQRIGATKANASSRHHPQGAIVFWPAFLRIQWPVSRAA